MSAPASFQGSDESNETKPDTMHMTTMHEMTKDNPMRTPFLILLAFLLVLPAGLAHAGGTYSRKNNRANPAPRKTTTPAPRSTPPGHDKGGIDPASFPVIDDDLMAMVDWTRWQLRAQPAHYFATGRGVTVAVLDGGFDIHHPAIAASVSPRAFDAVDWDLDPNDPGDGFDADFDGILDRAVGHGTFVAGMVLAAAPEATILPVRVRDDEGWGSNETLLRGLWYAWYAGADVINLSLSPGQIGAPEVREFIDQLFMAGIPVVVSAGNEGGDLVSPLGSGRSAITVPAVDKYDRLARWSNYPYSGGDALIVCAPGQDLYGPMASPWGPASGYWSGTSFATGFVSGAIALMKERHPEWMAWTIYDEIEQAVDPAFDPNGQPLPHGRVNLYRAVLR